VPYTPHTQADVSQMLETIGVESEEALFDSVPETLKTAHLDLPEGLDEYTALAQFQKMAARNSVDKVCFLGGGYYDHIIPAAVDALSMRSEFYTAYTPYQAEASQGTLQVLYEYQSLICRLTGMEVSNASMYDGATALAEAALMAVRITKRNKILIDEGVNPQTIKIVQTYLSFREIALEVVDVKRAVIDERVAGYLFQNPDFYGSVRDFTAVIEALHANKALAVMSVYPIALGMLRDPGSMQYGGGYRDRRWAVLGKSFGFRRAFIWDHCYQGAVYPRPAWPYHRQDSGQGRQGAFRPHDAGQRAAYPKTACHLQYLLQPKPHGSQGDDLPFSAGAGRTHTDSSALLSKECLPQKETG